MNIDDRLKKAVDSLGDKLRDEIAKELSSLNLAPTSEDDAATARLADALRAIDTATSLSDILETLAATASKGAARAGVFLLSATGVRSFRISGFPMRFDG